MHPNTFEAYKVLFAVFFLFIAGVQSAALSEERGENFEDAMDGLFEGDMRLTGDQLLALGMGKEEEARTKRQGEGEGGGEDEGEFFGDAIEDGLFEGDMRLTGDQLLALQRGTLETHGDLEGVFASEPSGNAIIGTNYLWPDKTVKFELASWLSGAEKTLVRRTLQGLQAKLNSCIRFVESSSGDRIFVKNNGGGCWSSVGHQEKTYQELSLQSGGCMHAGIIEHEFLHAIGLYHHQSRSDRDYYVKIIWGNIPEKVRHNFNKYSSTVVNHFNLPYDFQSVMHYGGADFGNGRTTIQTLDPTKQNVIGQRNGVSAGDIELLKKMYTCEANTGIGGPDDWKFCTNSICQKGQGDCDNDSECAGDLVCGEDNCRDFHQGAKRTADCCTEPDDGGTDECAYTDSHANCEAWAKEGYCSDSRYGAYMAKNCKASCECSETYSCQEVGINYQERMGSRVKPGIESWQRCQKLCLDDANCWFWVWNHEGAGVYAFNCALMAAYGNKANDQNTIAGPKTCS